MEILEWEGRRCKCRPQCESENASAKARCPNCGNIHQIEYGDEPPEGLEEWFGGTGQEKWCCQAWDDCISLDLPDDEGVEANQWLHDIADRLLADDDRF